MQVQSYDSVNYISTEGTIAQYAVKLRGTVAFYALVDESDPELKIYVSSLDHSKSIETNGRARMVTEYTKDVDGNPHTVFSHVNTWSVESYVKPRAGVLTARLYVPGFEQDDPQS